MVTEIRVNATKLEFEDDELATFRTLKELDDAVKLTGNQTKAGVLTLSDTPKMGAIAEKTADAGVTVDGLLIKDGTLANWDGWIIANETWTRTGNFTFTISGDVTVKYPKGTKVRYKDGGTYEYGYVISATYGAPNTTITLATNTDYAMAAATITDNYYSYVETPRGFPQYFNWTPTLYGSGAMTWTSTTIFISKFCIKGNSCFLELRAMGTTGGTAANVLAFSLPVSALNTTENYEIIGNVTLVDAGTYMTGLSINESGTKIKILKYNIANYSLGANTGFIVNGSYII